ncbi:class I SAM-dependent methyltransferase [Kitasatospora sp. NPDC058170]|uniref:class I SAM-dependent methyltransferase n=1 Tax=Kitasatospora sp. NPDC058170 TaxID=3346364 RepID=UPI0036DA137D
MGQNWSSDAELATDFNAYDDLTEQAVGFPLVFRALGLDPSGLDPSGPGHLLDYGCGPGRVSLLAARAHPALRVTGVDISPHMLGIAAERRTHERVHYRRIESADLSFLPDDSVDAAMSCFVFINIGDLETVREVTAEVYRVLRPGARYAVLDSNPETVGIRFATFRTGEPGRRYAPGETRRVQLFGSADTLEIEDYHWPLDVYREVLTGAGFAGVDVRTPVLADALALGAPVVPLPGGDAAPEATHAPMVLAVGTKPA